MLNLSRLGSAFRWPFARKSPTEALAQTLSTPVEASLDALGKARPSQVAPAIILATGAGVALWWWTQWARGSAESEPAPHDHDHDSERS